MKKLSIGVFLTILLAINIKASDLLSIATNGMFNSNSFGAKTLNTKEMQEIKGGYQAYEMILSNNELAVIAVPIWNRELPISISDTTIGLMSDEQLRLHAGICGLNQVSCNTSSYDAKHRLNQLLSVIGTNPYQNMLGYTVKRNIGYNNNGRYVYFSYGVAQFYAPQGVPNGSYYRINSSGILNNNMIIKELRDNFKTQFERLLNGY
ncbi:bacteriocin [Campylobacter porcelli]|uniref:Bacteriocin n=1 Tax=Campylobacter porcelli TaxID=1660073 RepID=A0ABU7M4K9_9BACT|nr:bacteriocin [Campylobacter sp. CX2-4855-23]